MRRMKPKIISTKTTEGQRTSSSEKLNSEIHQKVLKVVLYAYSTNNKKKAKLQEYELIQKSKLCEEI